LKIKFFYFRNFDDDEDDGPICTLFVAPPIAIINGAALSCDMSVNVCCRRLNSFNLSVVNCDDPVVVVVVDEEDGGGGGLFSISNLIFSLHSVFKSGLAAVFASVDEVDDDVDGGFASRIKIIEDFIIFFMNIFHYMASMDHDVDFVMMDQMLMRDVKLLDELKRPDNVQWNVDDDNQYNNDDNLLGVDEMNRRRLIVVAEKRQKSLIQFYLSFK
jgi:hypothetical protein